MRKKYKRTLLYLLAALILTSGLGVSYAIYEKRKSDYKNYSIIETDEYLSINYLDGKYFNVLDFKSGDSITKKISISNVGNNNTYVSISLMDVSKKSDNIKVEVYNSKKELVYQDTVTNIDNKIVKTEELSVGKTLSYTIIIKNEGEDTSFSANILAIKELIKQSNNNFKEILLKNNKVSQDLSKIGKEVADENVLVKMQDDLGDSYSFRGNTLNNNITIGDLNFKILRINGDNTIRLILDGTLDSAYAYNNNTEATGDYAEKLKYDNSSIKNTLDNFLDTTLSEYSKYIVDSSFCEDTNVYKNENNVSYLNPYNRTFVENNPTLVCQGSILKERIGLPTIDELTIAGLYRDNQNQNNFLYNEKIKGAWWTMSGSKILSNYNSVDAFSINQDNSINYERKISNTLYIRPVISLDANTLVSGSGTLDDPYVIQKK